MGIPVRNIQSMLTFYGQQLGFKVVSDEIEQGAFLDCILGMPKTKIRVVKMVAQSGWMLELLEYQTNCGKDRDAPKINDLGCAHIALQTNDATALYHQLKQTGIRTISTPQKSSSGHALVFFCQDPEGNFVEIVQII